MPQRELRCTQATSDRTPFIADLKPSGKYVMEDVHKVLAGHTPVFAAEPLLDSSRDWPASPARAERV